MKVKGIFGGKNKIDPFGDATTSPELNTALLGITISTEQVQRRSINHWLNKTKNGWIYGKYGEDKAVYKIVTDPHIITASDVAGFEAELATGAGLIGTLNTARDADTNKYPDYPNLTQSEITLLTHYHGLFTSLGKVGGPTPSPSDFQNFLNFAKSNSIGAKHFNKIMVFISTKDLVFYENFKKNAETFIAANTSNPIALELKNVLDSCRFAIDHQVDIKVKQHWGKINSAASEADIQVAVFNMIQDPIVISSVRVDGRAARVNDFNKKLKATYLGGHKDKKKISEILDAHYSLHIMLSVMADPDNKKMDMITIADLYSLKQTIGDPHFETAMLSILAKDPELTKQLSAQLSTHSNAINISIGQVSVTQIKQITDDFTAFGTLLKKAVQISDTKAALIKEFEEFARDVNPASNTAALNNINTTIKTLTALEVDSTIITSLVQEGFRAFTKAKKDDKLCVLKPDHFTRLASNFQSGGNGYNAISRKVGGAEQNADAQGNVYHLFTNLAEAQKFTITILRPAATHNILAGTTIFDISTPPASDQVSKVKKANNSGASNKEIFLAIKDKPDLAIPSAFAGDEAKVLDLANTDGDPHRQEWRTFLIKLTNVTNILGAQEIERDLKNYLSAQLANTRTGNQADYELGTIITLLQNPAFLATIPNYAANKTAVDITAKLIVKATQERRAELKQEETLTNFVDAQKVIREFTAKDAWIGVGVGGTPPSIMDSFITIANYLENDRDAGMDYLAKNSGTQTGIPMHNSISLVVGDGVGKKFIEEEKTYRVEAEKLDTQAREFKKQVDLLILEAKHQGIEGITNTTDFAALNPNVTRQPFLAKLKTLALSAKEFEDHAALALGNAIAKSVEALGNKVARAKNAERNFTDAVKKLEDCQTGLTGLDVNLITTTPDATAVQSIINKFTALTTDGTGIFGNGTSALHNSIESYDGKAWDDSVVDSWKTARQQELQASRLKLQEFATSLGNLNKTPPTTTIDLINTEFEALAEFFKQRKQQNQTLRKGIIGLRINKEHIVTDQFSAAFDQLESHLTLIRAELQQIKTKSPVQTQAALTAKLPTADLLTLPNSKKAADFLYAATVNDKAYADANNPTTPINAFYLENTDGTVSVNVYYSALKESLLRPTTPSPAEADKRIDAIFTSFRIALAKANPPLTQKEQKDRFRALVTEAAKIAVQEAKKDPSKFEIKFSGGSPAQSHEEYLRNHFNEVIMSHHPDAWGWIVEEAGGKGIDAEHRSISLVDFSKQSQTVTPVVVAIPKIFSNYQEKRAQSVIMERTMVDANTTLDICLSSGLEPRTFDNIREDLIDFSKLFPNLPDDLKKQMQVGFNSGPTVLTQKTRDALNEEVLTFNVAFCHGNLGVQSGTGVNKDLLKYQNSAHLPITIAGKQYFIEITLQLEEGSMVPVVYKRGDFTYRILEPQTVAGGIGKSLRPIAIGSVVDGRIKLDSVNKSNIQAIEDEVNRHNINIVARGREVAHSASISREELAPTTFTVKKGTVTQGDIGHAVSDEELSTTVRSSYFVNGSETLIFHGKALENKQDRALFRIEQRGITDKFILRNVARFANVVTLTTLSHVAPQHYNSLWVKQVLKDRGLNQGDFERELAQICSRKDDLPGSVGSTIKLELSNSKITDLTPLIRFQQHLQEHGRSIKKIDLTNCDALFYGSNAKENLRILELLGVQIARDDEQSVVALKNKIIKVKQQLLSGEIDLVQATKLLKFSKVKNLNQSEIAELAMFATEQEMGSIVGFSSKKHSRGQTASLHRILYSLNSGFYYTSFFNKQILGFDLKPTYEDKLFETFVEKKTEAVIIGVSYTLVTKLELAILEKLAEKYSGSRDEKISEAYAAFIKPDPTNANKSLKDSLDVLTHQCHTDLEQNKGDITARANIRHGFINNAVELLKSKKVIGPNEPEIYRKPSTVNWKEEEGLFYSSKSDEKTTGNPDFIFIKDSQITEKLLTELESLVKNNGLKGIKFTASCHLSGINHSRLDKFKESMKEHCPNFKAYGSQDVTSSEVRTVSVGRLGSTPVVKVKGVDLAATASGVGFSPTARA